MKAAPRGLAGPEVCSLPIGRKAHPVQIIRDRGSVMEQAQYLVFPSPAGVDPLGEEDKEGECLVHACVLFCVQVGEMLKVFRERVGQCDLGDHIHIP